MIKDGVTLIDVGISKVWTDKQLHNNNNNNNSRNQLFVGDADFHGVYLFPFCSASINNELFSFQM